MIKYFKNKAQQNALKTAKQKLKRKMGFTNFESISDVGIIIRYQLDIENAAVNKLFDFFKQKNIKPEILIHYPEKKLPANIKAQDNTLFFAEGDTNWFGLPKKKEIQDFINTEFGMLIDLSPEYMFPLHYIVEASKASFKVGRMSYENDPYDFVLLGSDNDSKYVDDLFNYLSKIE